MPTPPPTPQNAKSQLSAWAEPIDNVAPASFVQWTRPGLSCVGSGACALFEGARVDEVEEFVCGAVVEDEVGGDSGA